MQKTKNLKHNDDVVIIYGTHAVTSALLSGKRTIHKLLITDNALQKLKSDSKTQHLLSNTQIEIVNNHKVGELARSEHHQGIALQASKLPEVELAQAIEENCPRIMILDQITDTNNLGAIARSCAAFNVQYIIIPRDNSIDETQAVSKAASGALEFTQIIKVSNLSKAMEQLKKANYWCVGLDGKAKAEISAAKKFDKIAIIMGSEGKGMRELTRKSCDLLVKLPISDKIESLNVSAAAAITLYELRASNE